MITMSALNHITGIILAGGKSSRMGTDKGFKMYKNQPLVKHVIDCLSPALFETMIIANDYLYNQFGLPVHKDMFEDKGPISGIYTGLSKSNNKINYICTCDSPNVSIDLVKYLASHIESYDVVVPRFRSETYPLTAIYSSDAKPKILKAIEDDILKVKDVLDKLRVKTIDINTGSDFDDPLLFLNINTKEDLLNAENGNKN